MTPSKAQLSPLSELGKKLKSSIPLSLEAAAEVSGAQLLQCLPDMAELGLGLPALSHCFEDGVFMILNFSVSGGHQVSIFVKTKDGQQFLQNFKERVLHVDV